MLKRALAAGAVVLLLLSAGSALDRHAAVEGGIKPCSGLPISSPHYAAGTVRVYAGVNDPFFAQPIAVQEVAEDRTFHFILNPGQYTLLSGAGSVRVSLQPGDDVYADIPNMCI